MAEVVVFVAGPFRAKNEDGTDNSYEMEQNVRRAENLAYRVWMAGGIALCPHTNTRFFNGAGPDHIWLPGAVELLKRCDAVIMTEDWDSSSGASDERSVAIEQGIPVFYENLFSDFTEWLSQRKRTDEHHGQS